MESQDRTAASGLIQGLLDAPHLYDFYQIVQLLEAAHPARPRVGHDGPYAREVLRFHPTLSLAFARADVLSVKPYLAPEASIADIRYDVEATFLGLYGAISPLPIYYTEDLLHEAEEDSLVRGVLDLFHHRYYSLLYRAWRKYRHYILFQRGGRDRLSQRALCWIGMGVIDVQREEAIPTVRLLHFAGLLMRQPKSASMLAAAISDYFNGLPTAVEENVLRWVEIPEGLRNRLGALNSRLGDDLVPGERAADRSSTFRVSLGPLKLSRFLQFLPGERAAAALDQLVQLMNPDRLPYELELIVERDEVPRAALRERAVGARLGQASWLGVPAEDGRVVLDGARLSGVARTTNR